VRLEAAALPVLPGALELAAAGVRTGGDSRNREYVGEAADLTASEAHVALAFDPQTAGGLLIAIPTGRTEAFERAAATQDVFLARIGTIEDGSGVLLA
jgi:selenide,water dikinase